MENGTRSLATLVRHRARPGSTAVGREHLRRFAPSTEARAAPKPPPSCREVESNLLSQRNEHPGWHLMPWSEVT